MSKQLACGCSQCGPPDDPGIELGKVFRYPEISIPRLWFNLVSRCRLDESQGQAYLCLSIERFVARPHVRSLASTADETAHSRLAWSPGRPLDEYEVL